MTFSHLGLPFAWALLFAVSPVGIRPPCEPSLIHFGVARCDSIAVPVGCAPYNSYSSLFFT